MRLASVGLLWLAACESNSTTAQRAAQSQACENANCSARTPYFGSRGRNAAGAGARAGGSLAAAGVSGARVVPPAVQPGVAGQTPVMCASGSVYCDGNRVVRCEDGWKTIVEETCAFACLDGACTGNCVPGRLRCDAQDRQRCDDTGEWQTIETCSKVCTPNACVDVCAEGTRQCSGPAVVRCAGGKLVADTTCDFICNSGECTGNCLPGSRRCMDGAAASCGADGVWMPATECTSTCVDGACTGNCAPGARRCAGSGGYQTCNELGQWSGSDSCGGRACVLGACSTGGGEAGAHSTGGGAGVGGAAGAPSLGNCTPNSRRCDPSDPTHFQLCSTQREWGPSRLCGNGESCSTQGICAAPSLICQSTGGSPDWWSTTQLGGNPNLDDPRWGAAPAVAFAQTFGADAGGYVLLLDRAAGQLSVSVRSTLGPNEAPDARDYVYFGATPNLPAAPVARSATLPLIELVTGAAANPITVVRTSAYASGWYSETGGWLQHASIWRGGPNDRVSWAVSFRVDLISIGIDVDKPFRIALAAHADGASGDLATPVRLGLLTSMPDAWARATVDPRTCLSRIVLE